MRDSESPSRAPKTPNDRAQKTPIAEHNKNRSLSPNDDVYSDETTDFDTTMSSGSPTPRRENAFNYPPPKTPVSNKNESSSLLIYILIGCFVLIVAVGVGFMLKNQCGEVKAKERFNCSEFLKLSDQFPNQNKRLFRSLKSGVEGVRDGEVLVFTLFSTDDKLMGNFVDRIVKMTQECLNSTIDPIKLNENQINNQMIEDYKQKVMDSSIMILNNVDKTPIGDVQVLHSFCDTYNPLVKPLAIFITMNVPSSPSGKDIDFITEYLEKRWKNLKSNIRDPLITRIVDQTFYLKPQ